MFRNTGVVQTREKGGAAAAAAFFGEWRGGAEKTDIKVCHRPTVSICAQVRSLLERILFCIRNQRGGSYPSDLRPRK